jgi:hypothetical protein
VQYKDRVNVLGVATCSERWKDPIVLELHFWRRFDPINVEGSVFVNAGWVSIRREVIHC